MIFLGIDPGLSGAVAFWAPETRALRVFDMPTLRITPGSTKRTLDALQLAQTMDAECEQRVTLALIEHAQPRPGEGTTQSHANGRNWGIAYGIAAAQFVPLEVTYPHVWKRAMQCPKAKDAARARASQLLPEHAHLWPLVKHDGRAEAALIAMFAERRFRSRAVTP
jgi:crossover junction endodeoxyribonuclease RuvC